MPVLDELAAPDLQQRGLPERLGAVEHQRHAQGLAGAAMQRGRVGAGAARREPLLLPAGRLFHAEPLDARKLAQPGAALGVGLQRRHGPRRGIAGA